MTRICNYRISAKNSVASDAQKRADTGADRQIGGKNGIHQKLVNRLGTVDGIERF